MSDSRSASTFPRLSSFPSCWSSSVSPSFSRSRIASMSRSFLLSARTRFSLSLSLRIFGFGRAIGPLTRKLCETLHLFCSEEAIESADLALFCLDVFSDFFDFGIAAVDGWLAKFGLLETGHAFDIEGHFQWDPYAKGNDVDVVLANFWINSWGALTDARALTAPR
eukprot:scaffold59560_cov63-Phaeocystis_antarctica.AAC.4